MVGAFLEILEKPTIGLEMLAFLVPVWIAFVLGIVAGWAWKPRWVNLGCSEKLNLISSSLIPSLVKSFESPQNQKFNPFAVRTPLYGSCATVAVSGREKQVPVPSTQDTSCSSSMVEKEWSVAVTEEDLEHLCRLVDRRDGGPSWKHTMDCSTPTMSYQAWQRDPENGPPQYCSRTVYEDATAQQLRDFFWDDEFRLKWDDMLIHSAIIEECLTTGTMVVHWIRKFPFFCSDREYTIGRRIWDLGGSYYCVTKGVPCPSVPRRDKPRRVDLFYSSWCIESVASRKANDQLTACEVILFHHEDMGIPREIAKFGIRQGMWGVVKNIERGLRSYQRERASGAPLSHAALMAQINSKVGPDYLRSLESREDSPLTQVLGVPEKPSGPNIPKVLVFGGAIVLALSLDRVLLTKALTSGICGRFGILGRRL